MGTSGDTGPSFHRVLVAFDGGPASRQALALAAEVADPGAHALLLHVLPPDGAAGPMVNPTRRQRRRAAKARKDRVRQLESSARQQLQTLGFARSEFEFIDGNLGPMVADKAEGFGATLVALGGGDPSLVGPASAVRLVTGHARASVLVVRPWASAAARRGVAVATDLTPPSVAAAHVGLRLARRWDTRLGLVHILDQEAWSRAIAARDRDERTPRTLGEAQERARAALSAFNRTFLGGRAEEVLLTGNPRADLGGIAVATGAHLLVLGTQGPRTVDSIDFGSVAAQTAERTQGAVLLVKPAPVAMRPVAAPTWFLSTPPGF